VLYESYIHPITSFRPAFGGRGRLLPSWCGTDLGCIAVIGIVLLIASSKKPIHEIDFALDASAKKEEPGEGSTRPDCCVFRPDSHETMSALLSASADLEPASARKLRHPLGRPWSEV